jgi:hypothetical protein
MIPAWLVRFLEHRIGDRRIIGQLHPARSRHDIAGVIRHAEGAKEAFYRCTDHESGPEGRIRENQAKAANALCRLSHLEAQPRDDEHGPAGCVP